VLGSDGQVYDNACWAQAAGVAVVQTAGFSGLGDAPVVLTAVPSAITAAAASPGPASTATPDTVIGPMLPPPPAPPTSPLVPALFVIGLAGGIYLALRKPKA
jgi:hypothetical protein